MKVDFKIVSSPDQEGAVIRAVQKTDDIQAAIDILERSISDVVVFKGDKKYR